MADFEEIYCQYFGDVYRYILRLSQDALLAEEITSETFFRAMGAIDRFRGDCDLRVWLCQIGKHAYFAYLKKAQKTERLDGQISCDPTDRAHTPEELVTRQDTAARAQRALHAIAEPYKEVFMWRVFGELSFRQIGQVFGKSENWACVTYHRARKLIKKGLEENSDET